MASKEELLSQLNELKTLRAQLSAMPDDAPAKPLPPEPSLFSMGMDAVGTGAKNAIEGLYGIGKNIVTDTLDPTKGVIGIPGSGYAQGVLDRMVEHPETIAHNLAGAAATGIGFATGGLGGGASFPLLNQAAHQVNEWAGLEKPASESDIFKQLIGDSAGTAVAAGGINGTARALRAPAKISAATEAFNDAPNPGADFMAQPNTQAAARLAYSKNPEVFGGATPENAPMNSNTATAISAQQAVADEGFHSALGLQLGAGSSKTGSDRGLSAQWEESVKHVANDPDVVSAPDVPTLAKIAGEKANIVGDTRNAYAQSFDQQGVLVPTAGFDPVVATLLDDAQKLKDSPATEDFGTALEGLASDFRQFLFRRGGGGWAPSRLINMSEDFNLSRRMQGEFNRRNVGAASQGDVNAAMSAEVVASYLPKIQEHINGILDQLGATPANSRPFSQMQEQYGGWKALEQQAKEQAEMTKTGLTEEPPRNVVKNSGQTPGGSEFNPGRPVSSGVQSALGSWWDRLVNKTSPQAMKMFRDATRNERIMNNVRDFQTLADDPIDTQQASAMGQRNQFAFKLGAASRAAGQVAPGLPGNLATMAPMVPQKVDPKLLMNILNGVNPAPLLRRDFDLVKNDPNAMATLDNAAAQLRILPPGALGTLSEPDQKTIHKMVIQAAPQMAEKMPRNMNIVNNEYQNPMEKDAVMKEALSLPPTERARINGAAFKGEYEPLPSTPPVPQQPAPALPVTLEKLNRSLQLGTPSPSIDRSIDRSADSAIQRLQQMTAIHANDIQ